MFGPICCLWPTNVFLINYSFSIAYMIEFYKSRTQKEESFIELSNRIMYYIIIKIFNYKKITI